MTRAIWPILLGGGLLLACAHDAPPEPGPREPGLEALEDAAAQARAPLAPPPEVTGSLLPPLPGPEPFDADDEPRFDISVNEVPAREFFVSLVADTPYNAILHPDVSGKISLQLRSVTVREVLDVVRDIYGYEYHQTPVGFQIAGRGLRTRVFQVDYLDVRRGGASQTRVSSGQVSEQSDREDDALDDDDSAQGPRTPSGSVIATQSEGDFWHTLWTSLDLIVGREDGRSVVVSPETGTVVVRAYPEELRDVEYYLAAAEQASQRQVILEAKIIEVSLDDQFRTGINWAQLGLPGEDDSILGGLTGGGTLLDSTGLSEIAGNLGDLDPRTSGTDESVPASTDTSAFGGAFTIAAQSDEFAAFLELLESQGDVQVLSSPRVSTLNNQKAVIKVGSDEFFVTDISSTTVTGAATTTSPQVELTAFFSGIALDVTPQIGRNGVVTLHVHPSISEITDQIKTVSLGTDDVQLPLALSTIRESDSVVRARSGQVIVIGGLMQDNLTRARSGTPWLGRVPGLGWLFAHRLESSERRELVILLRALVVEPGTWERAVHESVKRVRDLRGVPVERAPSAPESP